MAPATTDATRPLLHLDDRAITWRPLPGYDGLSMWVLGVNEARQQVDIFFRLAPGARCPSHRHAGPTDTLVVEGEHRTWSLGDDGWYLDQIRPPGSSAATRATTCIPSRVGPREPSSTCR